MKVALLFVVWALINNVKAQQFSSSQGNCLKNGTIIWNGEGEPSPYRTDAFKCGSNYGRPQGVCNCIYAQSCAQLLAGCAPSAQNVNFTFPSILYVGEYYEFSVAFNAGELCTYRTLPEGLTAVVASSLLTISGTPTETVPMAKYGFATSFTVTYITFEVQACKPDDYVANPTEPTPPPFPEGSADGNCLVNGSIAWGVEGSPIAQNTSRYMCSSGVGRPYGVCNCPLRYSADSCAQRLAGCYGPGGNIRFDPPIPSVLYVGHFYEFRAEIPMTTHCFLRPLPRGLSISYGNYEDFSYKIIIAGIPIESMPMADYAVAVKSNAYGMHTFFSFEIQSCAEDDIAAQPTLSPTPSPTLPPTLTPTNTPTNNPTNNPNECEKQGMMRCVGTSQFQTCNRGSWDSIQSCQTGLVCSPSGDYIYCT